MVGTVDFRSILATSSVIIKHFYCIILGKLSLKVVFFLLFFTEKGLVLHFIQL